MKRTQFLQGGLCHYRQGRLQLPEENNIPLAGAVQVFYRSRNGKKLYAGPTKKAVKGKNCHLDAVRTDSK